MSGCYDVGARSVLTLHRLARTGGAASDLDELDLDEFDQAVWKLWQLLGRDERDYLAGQILDYQICYLGNADPGSTLEAEIALWRHRDWAAEEIVDVTLSERGSGRLIAIATQRILRSSVPAYAS